MRPLLVVAVVTLAMACASRRTPTKTPTPVNPAGPPPLPPPPPAPPPATGRATDAIRLGPSTMRYAMHQVVNIEQELPTGRQQVMYGLQAFFRVTINGPADSVGYPMTVSIDSIIPDSGTTVPMNVDLGVAKGLAFVGRLTPKGDFRNPTPSDSTAADAVSPIVGSFRNFFPRLPASGITQGATWTDTVTMNERATGNVSVKNITRSHAAGWEERNGTRCVRIEATASFTIQGGGEQLGQHFDVAGTGVRNGFDYVATDGRYMGGESTDSTNLTISLPVQSTTIPRTQVAKTTVMVLP